MSPAKLYNTVLHRNPRKSTEERDAYYAKTYPKGQPFDRLTLTLSAKGWTASVQWKGTSGARGKGPTIELAIDDALATVETQWNAIIK